MKTEKLIKKLNKAEVEHKLDKMTHKMTTLEEYCLELVTAVKWKTAGQTMVDANVAGTATEVTIDEYIAIWLTGIQAMAAGADQAQFNY